MRVRSLWTDAREPACYADHVCVHTRPPRSTVWSLFLFIFYFVFFNFRFDCVQNVPSFNSIIVKKKYIYIRIYNFRLTWKLIWFLFWFSRNKYTFQKYIHQTIKNSVKPRIILRLPLVKLPKGSTRKPADGKSESSRSGSDLCSG